MSKRQQLLSQAVEGPQLRTRLDIPPVDLRSPLIRQIVLEGQECQARIRRFRREGLVAWLEQADRLDTLRNVHNIVGTAFERIADEIGFDASTAYGLLQLHPFAARLLDECDRLAAADPKYRYPGWRTALEWMCGQGARRTPTPQIGRTTSGPILTTAQGDQGYFSRNFGVPPRTNDEVATPKFLFDHFDHIHHFDLDVSATKDNAKVGRYITKGQDALKQEWRCEAGWMNPPFSMLNEFAEKAVIETGAGRAKKVVALMPVYTDAKWFHDYARHAKVTFFRQRIRFENTPGPAPFSSILAVWENGFTNNSDSMTITLAELPKKR